MKLANQVVYVLSQGEPKTTTSKKDLWHVMNIYIYGSLANALESGLVRVITTKLCGVIRL